MGNEVIHIAGVVKESIVDGPGIRYVIFTQGCPHHCEGCHNPQTHDYQGGQCVKISKILEDIQKDPLLKGVTISGGEPFMQAKQVAHLIQRLDRSKYDVMVYTGYQYESLVKSANEKNGYMELLKSSDILMDGKFDMKLKCDTIPYRGSSNQRAIDLKQSLVNGDVILHNF